jgi:rRNA-processing protein EBP2
MTSSWSLPCESCRSFAEKTCPRGSASRLSHTHISSIASIRPRFSSLSPLPCIPRPLPPCLPPCSYGQALAAVSVARDEFDRLKVPHRRPDDYFAAMLKSDDHMQRVKTKLVEEQTRMKAVETRRAEKESAAFNKQTMAEKSREKAVEKRGTLDALKQWRKNKDDSRPELSSDKDLDKLFRGAGAGAPGGAGKGGKGGKGGAGAGPASGHRSAATRFAPIGVVTTTKGGKRKYKDKKYGFGGPKHFKKEGTAESSADMRDFSVKRMKSGVKGMKPFKGNANPRSKGGRKGGDRPGKWARSAKGGARK